MQPFTLAQLAHRGLPIYAVCTNCGHFSLVDPLVISKQCGGWNEPIDEVRKRLRCKTCGRRDCKLTDVRPVVGERVCPRCLRPFWKT